MALIENVIYTFDFGIDPILDAFLMKPDYKYDYFSEKKQSPAVVACHLETKVQTFLKAVYQLGHTDILGRWIPKIVSTCPH